MRLVQGGHSCSCKDLLWLQEFTFVARFYEKVFDHFTLKSYSADIMTIMHNNFYKTNIISIICRTAYYNCIQAVWYSLSYRQWEIHEFPHLLLLDFLSNWLIYQRTLSNIFTFSVWIGFHSISLIIEICFHFLEQIIHVTEKILRWQLNNSFIILLCQNRVYHMGENNIGLCVPISMQQEWQGGGWLWGFCTVC